MKNPLAMSVRNGARSLCYHAHALTRVLAQHIRCGTETSARRVLHAEKRQAFLAFADFVNWKNVWMIKAGDRFGFATKPDQCLVRVHLMREDPFHRDNATGSAVVARDKSLPSRRARALLI